MCDGGRGFRLWTLILWCCVVLDLGNFVMMVGFGFGYDGGRLLFGPFSLYPYYKRCMVGEIDPSSLVVGDFVFVGSSLGLLLYPTPTYIV